MTRSFHKSIYFPYFDYLSEAHNSNSVAHEADDIDVMRNEKITDFVLFLQILQQVQYLGLR